MGSLFFQICSMFYLILVLVIYFSKKKINTLENKIYIALVYVSFIALLVDMASVYLALINPYIVYANILCKLYLVSILAWVFLFTYYVFVISSKKNNSKSIELNKKFNYFKNAFLITIFLFFIASIIIFEVPLYIYSDGKIMYTYGPSAIISYAFSGICIIFWLVCIISNYKKIKDKKYLPVFAFIFLATIAIIIQSTFPEILLVTSVAAFIAVLTFFTIENPDMKMIEQLNIAKDQADKANMAKSDFLSSMSHEISTPLNAIVGFSEAIDTAESLEEAKENAKDVVSASNTLLEIVNGVLDISKIEAGKLEIVNSDYNTYELLNSVAKLLRPRMEEKGLEFKINIAGDIPAVLYGDHANLKKVITNILTNACKYTEKGYVEYKVSCVNNNNTTRLLISVEDTGRGIKKENIDKLFTRFQRLEEDRNTTVEGTGLGLAITKKLLDLMGGTIVVQSVYGSGSRFTVALDQKIKSMVLDVEETKVVKEDINLSNKKILIVDDNKLNLKVASKFLSNYNPIVETVESGFECIDKIRNNNKYDLILMDDMMPKMSGVETLKQLQNISGFNMPVVALTANAVSGMRDKYIKDGFNDYLAKPIDKQELKRVLSNLVIIDYNQPESLLGEIPNELFIISDEDIERIKSKAIPVEQPIMEEQEEPINENNVKNNDYLIKHGIDLNKSLELLGDMETYNETVEEFYNNLNDRVSKLESYKSDMPNYAIEVHALKSDSKYLGFNKLAELAYDHELKSKANEIDYINNTYDNLLAEVNKIKEIVKNYLGK